MSNDAPAASADPLTGEDQPAVAGLDPSLTSFGVAVWGQRDAQPYLRTIKSKSAGSSASGRIGRANQVIGQVFDLLDLWRPTVVVIEGYAYGAIAKDRDGNGVLQRGHWDRAELRGLLLADLLASGYVSQIYEVAPATLKAFIIHGHAKKEEIRDRVFSQWGINAGTLDEADAAGLAKMGRYAAGFDPLDELDSKQEAAYEVMIQGN